MMLPIFIINWTASSTSEMLSNAGGLIDDLNPLLVAVIGIGLGLIIFEVVVSVIRGRHSS
jgi:hypothetical protein